MEKNPDATREKIIAAFLHLYESRRIEKISIGELTREAGLYRGTFYYYYKDIYDLLEQLEERFISEISEVVEHVIDGIFTQTIEQKVPYFRNYYLSHHQMIQLFLIGRPNPAVLKKMKENAKKTALTRLGTSLEQLPANGRYIIEYIASAQLGLFTLWIEKGQEITPDELAELIQSVNTSGPLTCLLKEISNS